MLDLDSLKVNEHCHLQATILKAAWFNFFSFFLQTYCTHIHDSFTDRFLFLSILLHLCIIYNPNMPYFVFVFCSRITCFVTQGDQKPQAQVIGQGLSLELGLHERFSLF